MKEQTKSYPNIKNKLFVRDYVGTSTNGKWIKGLEKFYQMSCCDPTEAEPEFTISQERRVDGNDKYIKGYGRAMLFARFRSSDKRIVVFKDENFNDVSLGIQDLIKEYNLNKS